MLSVLKVGGSVLRDERVVRGDRGVPPEPPRARTPTSGSSSSSRRSTARPTSSSLEAQAIAAEPDSAALDLLWSTGRAAIGRPARASPPADRRRRDSFQRPPDRPRGLPSQFEGPTGQRTTVRPLRLLAALGASRLVIVPGFLGVSAGGTITSLGRGGSDLTAVLLAIAVRADACELIKDVPGYFTADPHRDAAARQLHDLPIDQALGMADAGCDLVQRAALAAAAQAGLHLVIRSMDAAAPVTHVHSISRKDRSTQYGVRHQDDSRRAAVGA